MRFLLSLLLILNCQWATVDGQSSTTQTLFSSASSEVPYRIPAIVKNKKGELLAFTDYRHCLSDIGFGRVDLHYRISKDNGRTWGPEQTLIEGNGIEGDHFCGFGDAAVVADSKSNEVLLLCVCGQTPYFQATRDNPNRVAAIRSYDGGHTWGAPEEITESIYTLFDDSQLGPVQSLFVGSGKITQSRKVKVGKYYRIYAALCARPGGNRVIYSDDFGHTWHSLGTIHQSPAPLGDEPKIEELPDGSVLLSSRPGWGNLNSGRFYNIYGQSSIVTPAGVASGSPVVAQRSGVQEPRERSVNGQWSMVNGQWSMAVASAECPSGVKAENNVTNGEILIVKVSPLQVKSKAKSQESEDNSQCSMFNCEAVARTCICCRRSRCKSCRQVRERSSNAQCYIALQSVPLGPGRSNVGIYWKALSSPADYANPESFASGWSGPYLVTTRDAAYSTMCVQQDGRIGFFWEDTSNGRGGYEMLYRPISISTITAGRYEIKK